MVSTRKGQYESRSSDEANTSNESIENKTDPESTKEDSTAKLIKEKINEIKNIIKANVGVQNQLNKENVKIFKETDVELIENQINETDVELIENQNNETSKENLIDDVELNQENSDDKMETEEIDHPDNEAEEIDHFENVNKVERTTETLEKIQSNIEPDITNLLSEINKKNSENVLENTVKKPKVKKQKKPQSQIPRGQPKSGRFWKTTKQKFSNVKKSIYRRPFEQKVEFRNDIKHIKELSASIKEERKQQNEHKRMRREQNAKIKLENQLKSEIVQVIKNPARIKRMKKKQLRLIEKRDLSKIKVIT